MRKEFLRGVGFSSLEEKMDSHAEMTKEDVKRFDELFLVYQNNVPKLLKLKHRGLQNTEEYAKIKFVCDCAHDQMETIKTRFELEEGRLKTLEELEDQYTEILINMPEDSTRH